MASQYKSKLKKIRKKHKKSHITLASNKTIKSLIVNENIIDDWIEFNSNIGNKRIIDNLFHQFDKVYNLDIQRLGITLFFRNDMHFFDIMEKEFEVKIDRNKFDSTFKFNLTSSSVIFLTRSICLGIIIVKTLLKFFFI